MYDVEIIQLQGRGTVQVTIALMGETVMQITDGNTLLIALTYEAARTRGDAYAQEFIHGVLCGLNHVAMSGRLPVVVAAISDETQEPAP